MQQADKTIVPSKRTHIPSCLLPPPSPASVFLQEFEFVVLRNTIKLLSME